MQAVTRGSLFRHAGTDCRPPRAPGEGGEHCYGETARRTPQDDPASPECLWVSLADLCQEANGRCPSTRRKSHHAFGHKAFHNRRLAHEILTPDLEAGAITGQGAITGLGVENGCHRSRLAPESLLPAPPHAQPIWRSLELAVFPREWRQYIQHGPNPSAGRAGQGALWQGDSDGHDRNGGSPSESPTKLPAAFLKNHPSCDLSPFPLASPPRFLSVSLCGGHSEEARSAMD